MISLQGLLVLGIVAWYSMVIMKSTNSYYKEAYKKHLDEEAQRYQQGLVKDLDDKKETKCEGDHTEQFNAKKEQKHQFGINKEIQTKQVKSVISKEKRMSDKEVEDYCHENVDSDVCPSNSKEALIHDMMYKKFKNYP